MTQEEKVKQAAALSKAKEELVAASLRIKITNKEGLEASTNQVKKVKAYRKSVKEYWDPLCENAHKTWKALTARRKEFLDPADAHEKVHKLAMGRYAEAERARAARELRKRQEAERKAAEEKRLAEVEELRGMGELEAADHIAEQPLEVAPIAAPQETKVDGLSTSNRYSAEVVNLGEFLSFLAREPRWHYLIKDFPMKELNKLATAQKELFDIPGVKLVKKLIPSVRS